MECQKYVVSKIITPQQNLCCAEMICARLWQWRTKKECEPIAGPLGPRNLDRSRNDNNTLKLVISKLAKLHLSFALWIWFVWIQ